MKTQEKSNEWWNKLSTEEKVFYTSNYMNKSVDVEKLKYLYEWQIEEMYKKEIQEKSDREKAIEWWKGLEYNNQFRLSNLHLEYYHRTDTLTGREIEQIWRKETQQELERGIVITKEERPQVDFEMLKEITQINYETDK